MNIKIHNFLYNAIIKSNMTSKYACAIIYRNKIIAIGINKYSKFYISADYETNRYSIHAEKDAIMKIKDKNILQYCKIYIVTIKNNKLEKGYPCPMCYNLLKKYNMNKIL